jgi:hypothetical protein
MVSPVLQINHSFCPIINTVIVRILCAGCVWFWERRILCGLHQIVLTLLIIGQDSLFLRGFVLAGLHTLMAKTFYIYTINDLNPPDPSILDVGSSAVAVAGSVAPDIIQVSDDDFLLDPAGAGDTNQVLAADLVVDGALVGHAGDPVSVGKQNVVTDLTAGPAIGTFSTIIVNGTVVGFASNLLLGPGAALVVDPPQTGTAVPYTDFAACFTRDTRILAEDGEVPVQALKVGDLVPTRHNGPQPIRWIGSRKTRGHGHMAPIRFKEGVLGNTADILVSPMHRMLVDGPRARVLFDLPEVLAHARDLCDGERIFSAPMDEVEYFHILFDDHQIIRAHGCWSESFAPRRGAIDAFSQASREEILELFPHLDADWQDALPTLTAAEAVLLIRNQA